MVSMTQGGLAMVAAHAVRTFRREAGGEPRARLPDLPMSGRVLPAPTKTHA